MEYKEFRKEVVKKIKKMVKDSLTIENWFVPRLLSSLIQNAEAYAHYNLHGFKVKAMDRKLKKIYEEGFGIDDLTFTLKRFFLNLNPYVYTVHVEAPSGTTSEFEVEIVKKEDMTEEERKQFERYKQEFICNKCMDILVYYDKEIVKLSEKLDKIMDIVCY